MLSKSKGLILRVAAVMHVAFHLESPHEIPKEISQKALEAAQDFVDMCCQHAAFMAGRGEIADVIQQLQTGLNNHILGISVQKKLHTAHILLVYTWRLKACTQRYTGIPK